MEERIEEHDVVALVLDFPKLNLKKGDRGTIANVLAANCFIVEFCGSDVYTSVCKDFYSSDLEIVWKSSNLLQNNNMENIEQIEQRTAFGISKEQRKQVEIEESLETLSRYLDGLFKIPGVGWKFGLDSIIGLIPNVGDMATSLVSFYILVAGVRYGVPKITLLRMAFNIGLDYVVGSIPFLGDAFDFFWKSNKQNIDLIRERATGLGKGTTSDWLFVGGILLTLLAILVGSIFVSLLILGIVAKGFWDLFNL
jgi:Domain of unknown function (DUF4112)/Domain of unknown function (DUF4926)